MRYTELKIYTDKKVFEDVREALTEAGFTDMMIDDPEDVRDILGHRDIYKYDYISDDLCADMDRDPCITLYFGDDEEGRKLMQKASDTACESLDSRETVRIERTLTGDDSEWLYKWQENFKPAKIGERIVVRPGWEDYDPAPGELVIEMEPGMAFGSGLHATTSMCIKALEKYLEGGPAAVLDVGTGTAILAIAAALLGADKCLGIDIDPEAVRVGTENVARNGLSDRIEIREGDLTEGIEDFKADIIVANLMADLVVRLSPAASKHLKNGGLFISSGILDVKEKMVCDAIKQAGFEIYEVMDDGEWRAVVAVKK